MTVNKTPVTNDNTVNGGISAKRGSAPNITQTDLLLDIDFSSNSSNTTAAVVPSQPQATVNQPSVTSSSSGTMFDSLDVHTQPVATTTATTNTATTANMSSASGGVFGDLVDLFGTSNNTSSGLLSQPPQASPQNVCVRY